MAVFHQDSPICLKSEYDLFSIPPTQLCAESSRYTEYAPIASLSSNSQIEFNIIGIPEEYIDLSQTLIHVQGRVLGNSTKRLLVAADDGHVIPENYLLHNLFQQVDVKFNNKLVSTSNNMYPFKSYIQALLNYIPSVKAAQLSASMWITSDGDRATAVNRSRIVDLVGRLHSDIFMQDRLLLSNVDIKISLTPSKPEFIFRTTNRPNPGAGQDPLLPLDPIWEFTKVEMLVKKVKPTPSILNAHAATLLTSTAKYPFRKCDIRTHTVNAGLRSTMMNNVFLGEIPTRLVVGIIPHTNFNGSYATNPFTFGSYNHNSFALYIDGQLYNGRPFEPNWESNNYAWNFIHSYLGMGFGFRNETNGISYSDFKRLYMFYVFDLTPDNSANDDSHLSVVRNGNVRMELKFSEDVMANGLTVIIYSEKDALLEIDASRNILSE